MGAALKLRIEYEWVIPDENIPVFTLFTEGATYHSVSLNSSFQWPRLQSFNLLHEPGPQLVVSIPNCWSLLSCITGLASESYKKWGSQYGSIFEILLVYVEKILSLTWLPDYSRSTPRHRNLEVPLLSGILRGLCLNHPLCRWLIYLIRPCLNSRLYSCSEFRGISS